jgi:chromosome partitioning protein
MKTITLLNEKGGVGKTTLATHIASGLAIRGHRVVLVDADPQGTASASLGLTKEPRIYDLFVRGASWQDTLQLAPQDNYTNVTPKGSLLILTGNTETRSISNEMSRITEPRRRFQQLEGFADYVIIDTPPTPSLLHSSILLATNHIIFPTHAEVYSTEGLSESLSHAADAQKTGQEFGLEVASPAGIVPTMYRSKTGLHQGVLEQIREKYGDMVWEGLPLRIVYGEAAFMHQMVFAYAPDDVATREMWRLVDRVESIGAMADGEA